ncbi:YceD family protein [Persicitalea jodogahamensis]|uniref:DNA-binding protein n=1 Tax=Persicitalea jodogahamensis TaxID=402147 RepID=A0A8J3GA29_9BACT|nr:DUF177 domain-containing protein [Persicitalea jodogahamensis]GHB69314.1 DNA-binding protein [Persicitalea jodogahamensis]
MQSFLQNEVKELSKYNIGIYGLEDKPYEFDYEIGPAFFQEIAQDLIERGDFQVHLRLEKSSTMIQLWFDIKGSAELTCDRSLEPFDEPVDTQNRMILKFGDREEELTEEISIINRNATQINVAGYIYEFIALALPMKKIHPDLRNQEEDGDETETLIYSSEKQDSSEGSDKTDPRWEALKKLKNE